MKGWTEMGAGESILAGIRRLFACENRSLFRWSVR